MLVDTTPIVGIAIVPVTIQKTFQEPYQQGDKHIILRVLLMLTNVLSAPVNECYINSIKCQVLKMKTIREKGRRGQHKN